MPVTSVHQSLAIHASEIQPVSDYVFIEVNEEETKVGGIIMPLTYLERFPTSGWVHAVGPDVKEDIKRGDFVLMEEEGINIDFTYYDVFEIVLKHEDGTIEAIFADIEVEPVVKEQVEAYRRGGPDVQLTMMDRKNGGSIQFNCHNVMDWQFGHQANPSYDLSYLPTYMCVLINEDSRPAFFYLAHERSIMAVIEY